MYTLFPQRGGALKSGHVGYPLKRNLTLRGPRGARCSARRSGHALSGAAALALAISALVSPAARPAAAQDDTTRVHPFRMQIALAGGRERFHRGGADPTSPVRDLVVTMTLTNPSKDLAVSLPEPKLTVYGGPEFDVYLLGAPTGVERTKDTPDRTPVRRDPMPFPVGLRPEMPEVTLKPGESKEFNVDVGACYDVGRAGKYEMSCRFEEERSNTVSFEVLPLKVVDMGAQALISRLEDFERGGPRFPFMFYLAHGGGRFDEIIYLVRRGRGADEHFEHHRLAELAPGTVPDMMTSPTKVGLVGVLCPDKRSARKSRLFVLNFGVRPLKVRGEEIIHEPGMRPGLVAKPDGDIGAEMGAPPVFSEYNARPAAGVEP